MASEVPERIVTIFGGAKCSENDPEYAQARRVGQLLADSGFTHLVVSQEDVDALDFAETPEEAVAIINEKSQGVTL
jgi:hypothetical protein